MSNHLVDPDRIAQATIALAMRDAGTKLAFVPGGDPAMTGDPAAQGGGQDPAAAAGGAPGGAPAPAPGGGAPGGGQDIGAMVQNAVQSAMAMHGGGMGGGAPVEPIKPKIDVNVEMMQIKKMLARIADTLGVQIPASDMAVNSQDLTQMAMGQGQAGGAPGGAAGGGAAPSAIPPVQPMTGAAPGGKQAAEAGTAYAAQALGEMGRTAAGIAAVLERRRRA